jgi:hypothetical protein
VENPIHQKHLSTTFVAKYYRVGQFVIVAGVRVAVGLFDTRPVPRIDKQGGGEIVINKN